MSLEEKKLRNDIESYLRGEEPPADEMDKAARLDGWAPTIARGPNGAYRMTLHGRMLLGDGSTGEIVWLDRRYRWARTRTRLWKLGEPEGSEIPIDGVDL
ncbi:hypothetical protein M2171_002434 [Bradyrhizobium japonicum USDA 38]|uniref:hypothetical protein n=1 Tax=Bradyrhizobium japonicum TaxID=375 RepID=UPI0003FC5F7A|nr:hypothetical protein [Bradyrhizobium japonicum]MCS3893301.1 hypothetical protein [Bradyrhizobium japonicum USDA 38]MCS3945815.1 hypothetical protein [Bradyrhizobium japonicum]